METAEVLRSITGNVAISGVTFPVACGGTSATLDSAMVWFVPTAQRTGEDAHTGRTAADSTFTIDNLPSGTYTLGTEAVTFANGDSLVYTAAATPATVTLAGGANGTADYAISAIVCR